MVPEILTSSIVPIPWSDHNAVYTTITSTIPKTYDTTWYLPDSMLKHPFFCLSIEQALKDFLTHNTSPDISTLTLWERTNLYFVECCGSNPQYLIENVETLH